MISLSVPTRIALRSSNAKSTLFASVRSVTQPAAPKTFHSIPARTSTNHAGHGIRRYASLPISHRRRQRSALIQTLDRHRLSPSDFIDLSCQPGRTITTPSDNNGFSRTRLVYTRHRADDKTRVDPFPEDARGFLYLHRVPGATLLSNQIRFRKTASSDPNSFDAGQDLALPKGVPWSVSLLSSHLSTYDGLMRLLVHDGLISLHDLSQKPNTLHLTKSTKRAPYNTSQVLSTLDQPFSVKYGYTTCFWVMTNNDEVLDGRIDLRDRRSHLVSPLKQCTGTVLCCLELSDRPEHKGTRTLVLRVLSIVEEPKPLSAKSDNYFPIPVVGELLPHIWRVNRESGLPVVWSYNVDDCFRSLEPLRYLVDASEHRKV